MSSTERDEHVHANGMVAVERKRLKKEGCRRVHSRDQWRDSTEKGTSVSAAGGRRAQMMQLQLDMWAGRQGLGEVPV